MRNLQVLFGVSNLVKSKLLKKREGRLLFIFVGANKQKKDKAKENNFAFIKNILADKKGGGEVAKTIRINFFTRMYLLVKRNKKRGGGGQSKYLLLTLTGGEADAWLDTKDQLFKNWNPFVQYFSNLVFFFS